MEKITHQTENEFLVRKYKELLKFESAKNSKPDYSQTLSREQWTSFTELVSDLELNDQGVKILFQEVNAGRVLLPCDRMKKISV